MAMTPEEHQLIIEMFKRQVMLYLGLVELLRSRGLLDKGDLRAFDSIVSPLWRETAEANIEADYLAAAAMLGVTDLPES